MRRPGPTQTYLARIRQNVDDYYADRISYEEFGARQVALWKQIAASPVVHRLVLRELRRDLPAATPHGAAR
jgi:hypothetical protein